MFNYNLPTQYFSYSQYSKWKWSKKEYFQRYFNRQKDDHTPFTIFGQRIAENLEAIHFEAEPPHDLVNFEVVSKKLKVLGQPEVHIVEELEPGLKVQAYIDTATDDLQLIHDYKTGQKPREQNWKEQLMLYALLIYLQHGFIPSCGIQFMQTKVMAEGAIVELTGNTKVFEYTFTYDELMSFKDRFIGIAKEISNNYTAWLGDSIREQEFIAFSQAREKLQYWKTETERLERLWREHMTGHGVTRYEHAKGVYQEVKQKRWIIADTFADQVKTDKKLLAEKHKEKGWIEQNEITTYRFQQKKEK